MKKIKNTVNNSINKALYNLFGIVQPNKDQSFLTPQGVKYTVVPNDIDLSDWAKGQYSEVLHSAS